MQWPLYLLTRAWLAFLGALPLPIARRISIGLGRVVLFAMPRLHRVAAQQIDAAFGESITRAAKRRILLEAMDNLCIVAAEFPHGPRLAKKCFAGIVRVEGAEHVDRSTGALFISGHLANWEWMGAAWWLEGVEGAEVVRPLSFPPLDRFVNGVRAATGITTIERDEAASQIFSLLKQGTHVGILIDQAPRESAVPCTFFGRACWATAAPAIVAARAKANIHFMGARRLPDYTYVLDISPPLPLVKTGNLLQDLVQNTQLCQDELEKYIRQSPGQWLWFHRRWKHRERLAQEWAARMARVNPVARNATST